MLARPSAAEGSLKGRPSTDSVPYGRGPGAARATRTWTRLSVAAAALVVSLFVGVAHAAGGTSDPGPTTDGTPSGTTGTAPTDESGEEVTPPTTAETNPTPPAVDGPATEPLPNPAPPEPTPVNQPPVSETPPAETPVIVLPDEPPATETPVSDVPPVDSSLESPPPIAPEPAPGPPVLVPEEPAPQPAPPSEGVHSAPAPGSSIVVIEPPSPEPVAVPAPALPALPPPLSDTDLARDLSARSETADATAGSSSAGAIVLKPSGPPPAALKALDGGPSAPKPAPSPSGVAGVAGASSSGGSNGLFAVLVALLVLGPPILSRVLAPFVALLRPTTLVLQLSRPG
jgi:hypothetical protein